MVVLETTEEQPLHVQSRATSHLQYLNVKSTGLIEHEIILLCNSKQDGVLDECLQVWLQKLPNIENVCSRCVNIFGGLNILGFHIESTIFASLGKGGFNRTALKSFVLLLSAST